MTVHAVRYKALAIVDMGGSFPCVIRKLDLVAGCAELRRRRSHHGVIGYAENWKADKNPGCNENRPNDIFFHYHPPIIGRTGFKMKDLPAVSLKKLDIINETVLKIDFLRNANSASGI